MDEQREHGPRASDLPGAPTIDPNSPSTGSESVTPVFPIPGWERYQGIRFLGQGGMGQVFLAYDPRLRRNLALKFVKGDDSEHIRRLMSEARAQARVAHESVCQVHEVAEVAGRPYIAMQFIDGAPLGQLAGQLSVEQKVQVVRDAARGVHAAHRAGLIHRDLKPANILVERTEDGRLRPYVMDFGLAHDWTASGGTATGSVLGTPHYMSPEQARGEVGDLDRRADVYSLGATLYQVLTGHLPISGENGLEVLSRIPTVEPRPPRALVPELPTDLEAIVLKCLEKDRAARYDSAHALAEELDRFLVGEPVQARSLGLAYRLRKQARRHRVAVSVGAVALVLVACALGWAAFTRQQTAERERLARRFTERVESIEARARYSALSRLHDVRADRAELRQSMEALEQEIRQAGDSARGPGSYALGRGELALGNKARAREQLEAAWRYGFREPRVAWAMALVLGGLYREQLLEVENLQSPERRESARRALQAQYREAVLDWLQRSEGADVPSPEYVSALLAFHEERLDEALGLLDTMGQRRPWFYEALQLRGDILQVRAHRRWNQGDRDGARADLKAGRESLLAASATAESLPEVHESLAKLEYTELVMELYSRGDIQPSYARGLESVARMATVDPDSPVAKFWGARFHNRLAEARLTQGGDVEEPLQKAIAAAQAALTLQPDHTPSLRELVQSLLRRARSLQGRGLDPVPSLRQALEELDRLPEKERDYESHATRGLLFRVWADREEETGAEPSAHLTRAIDAYRQAIQLDERLPDAWINLGQAYLKRAGFANTAQPEADLEQARRALEKSRELNPRNFVAWYLGGTLHTDLALRHRDAGADARPDLATAVELFRRGIDINARVAPLQNGLGIALVEQGREAWERGTDPEPLLAQAQAAYEQAVAVAPQQGWGQNNVGDVHAARAEYQFLQGENPGAEAQAAEAAFMQAVTLLPGQATPWANLAKVRSLQAAFALEQGRDPRKSLDKAQEALAQAFQRNPEEAQAWFHQGEVHELRARWLGQQHDVEAGPRFEQAAQAYEKALQLAPRLLDYRAAFGHFCREWARWLKASGQDAAPPLKRGQALADALLSARPDWTEALLLKASLLAELGTPDAQLSAKALAANPHWTVWWRRQQSGP
ncbi:serine/threonine-protein kinase [Hyalangium versicolor]|uniref:serine/threonine-protein kinase n=1 Tax=Hyalangium versicolor TaxID=2861190 RepID=UPI001CCE5117|nr:serine/threonine-protein kinase [Hyalangium versicolor]